MKFTHKCFAVAMSALFAATPVAPVNAMPIAGTPVQQSTTGDITLVKDGNPLRPYWVTPGHRREARRDARRWDRADRGHRWRGRDRGYRDGYYRGHRGYRYARPGYRHYNGYWFPLAAFGAGAIIGGAIANDRGYSGGGGSHVNWCANRYRSYRAYDNTFQPYGGPRQQCISPYR